MVLFSWDDWVALYLGECLQPCLTDLGLLDRPAWGLLLPSLGGRRAVAWEELPPSPEGRTVTAWGLLLPSLGGRRAVAWEELLPSPEGRRVEALEELLPSEGRWAAAGRELLPSPVGRRAVAWETLLPSEGRWAVAWLLPSEGRWAVAGTVLLPSLGGRWAMAGGWLVPALLLAWGLLLPSPRRGEVLACLIVWEAKLLDQIVALALVIFPCFLLIRLLNLFNCLCLTLENLT